MPSVRSLVLWYVTLFGVFGWTAHGFVENTDSEITLNAARAWWLRGDPGLVRADQVDDLAPGAPTWPAEHLIAAMISDPSNPLYGRTGRDDRHYVWFPIGHQALLVPAVAAGELLDRWLPKPAERFASERGPIFGDFFWSRFVASFLSPLCAAGSAVLLLWIARALGAGPREALVAAGACVFATQFWPGTSETMSNVPGAFFLIATAAAITGYATGRTGRMALLVAGLTSGLAILVRYPQLVSLVPLWLWGAVAAWRRRSPGDLVWLVLGGVPGLALLLWANYARFGMWTETGYTRNAGFGDYAFPLGFASILLAPGKGLIWFSPLAWLVVWNLRRRSIYDTGLVAAVAVFVLPLLLFSTVPYWAAGQCWGVRYLTAPLVLMSLFVLVRARPWQRTPRFFLAVVTIGMLVSFGGVLAPYTGQQALAFRAGQVMYGPQENLDNNVNWSPRLSPVHSHWTYAIQALRDRIGSGRSADTTEALFCIAVEEPVRLGTTETGFRHWWWRMLPAYWPGFPGGLVAAVWAALTALVGWRAWRRWFRSEGATS